ncbi:MAG: hypothetical protein K2P08_09595 [Oscillospiraceae bacterium]|nr:hypothetical protein [Oscillospiraceae bacterium]
MEPAFDAQQAAYLAQHDEAKELLEAHSPKEGDGPECDEAVTVDGGPVIPAGFDLWVDVNMSIKLRTKSHPDGEWVTLWCDDEPSPVLSEGKYFFWSWWKSSWKTCQKVLEEHGIPILSKHYYWYAPCDIAIPYDYVVDDPYNR